MIKNDGLEYQKTLFLDIDGVLLKHHGNLSEQMITKPELLPGTLDKLNEWGADGHKLILTTGRKESMRKLTEDQLLKLGIFYDQLVMGLNRGERIVINDSKPNNDMVTASAIQIDRNVGIKNIKLK